MDFSNLNADVNKILTKHFTKGRGGNKIQFVVIHYNYGDLTVEGCYSVWQTREASAHYQVESSGRIGQLVWDGDTAWHAGNFSANQKSIGIEHANQGDSMTDACIENGAHLCAAVCKYYGLGRPEWMLNVFPHCHFSSTSCPGPLKEGTSYHDKYMERAQYWYDVMTGTKTESNDRSVSVQLYTPNNTDAQKFAVEWVDDDSFRLKSVSCGLYLDVAGASKKSGTAVRVYTGNGTDAQRWKIKQQCNGQYSPDFTKPVEIIPYVNEDLRLDCVASGDVDGTGIQTYTHNDTGAQQWQILDHGDGTWTLINVDSSKALDVVGGGK